MTTLTMGAPLTGSAGIDVGSFDTGRSIVMSKPPWHNALDGTPGDAKSTLSSIGE